MTEHVALTPAEHILWELWISMFAARRDVFVVDSRLTIKEPLDVQLCARAGKLGHAISGYLAAPIEGSAGYATTMGAIDVDTTLDDALAIRVTLHQHGIPTLMSLSRRGAHLWMWTQGDGTASERSMPVPAPKVRHALDAAVKLTIADAERRSHIEVFPKAARSPLGVGTLRMPLMRHPKSGLIYPVRDMDGRETSDRLAAYEMTVPMDSPYEAVRRLATAVKAPATYPRTLGRQRAPVSLPEGPGVVALLAAMGVSGTLAPGRSVRCPFHEDKHASLSIAADDQRVFCKAPACPTYNGGRGLGSLALAKLVKKA